MRDQRLADSEIDKDADWIEISNTSKLTSRSSRFKYEHQRVDKKQYGAFTSEKIRSRTSFVCTFRYIPSQKDER